VPRHTPKSLLTYPRASEQVAGRVPGKAAGRPDSGAIGASENAAGRRPGAAQPRYGGISTGSKAIGPAPRAAAGRHLFTLSRVHGGIVRFDGDVTEFDAGVTELVEAAEAGRRSALVLPTCHRPTYHVPTYHRPTYHEPTYHEPTPLRGGPPAVPPSRGAGGRSPCARRRQRPVRAPPHAPTTRVIGRVPLTNGNRSCCFGHGETNVPNAILNWQTSGRVNAHHGNKGRRRARCRDPVRHTAQRRTP
jgi:hypothetical protein